MVHYTQIDKICECVRQQEFKSSDGGPEQVCGVPFHPDGRIYNEHDQEGEANVYWNTGPMDPCQKEGSGKRYDKVSDEKNTFSPQYQIEN